MIAINGKFMFTYSVSLILFLFFSMTVHAMLAIICLSTNNNTGTSIELYSVMSGCRLFKKTLFFWTCHHLLRFFKK